MKTIIVAALFGLLSTAAFAKDFSAPTTTLQFNHNMFEASIAQTNGKVGTVKVGAYILPHTIGRFNDDIFASVGYDVQAKTTVLGLDYKMSTPLGDKVLAYGTLGTSYTVSSNTKDEFRVNPSAGLDYTVNDKLHAFGEVGYSWNATNSWAHEGGYAKLGLNYMLTDVVYIEPSIIRSFDTTSNDTNVVLKVGVSF